MKPGTGETARPSKQASTDATIDAVLQGALGKKLRDSYQEVVNEEVPDKFLTLLQELKRREANGGGRTS